MKILIVGNEADQLECRRKFGDQHDYVCEDNPAVAQKLLAGQDLVFDFHIDRNPEAAKIYTAIPGCIFFMNTAKISLHNLAKDLQIPLQGYFFGFPGIPTFLDRPVLEVSMHDKTQHDKLKEICLQLKTEFQVVEDRVGLVTPRVIAMVINEAYFVVEEGTASREDIDLAMKLGTNYPWGPLEWSKKIGLNHVFELLHAVYRDTGDERYRVCNLLKQEYLASIEAQQKSN